MLKFAAGLSHAMHHASPCYGSWWPSQWKPTTTTINQYSQYTAVDNRVTHSFLHWRSISGELWSWSIQTREIKIFWKQMEGLTNCSTLPTNTMGKDGNSMEEFHQIINANAYTHCITSRNMQTATTKSTAGWFGFSSTFDILHHSFKHFTLFHNYS